MTKINGRKYDNDKLRWSLIPWSAMKSVVRVLMDGAKKYDDYNWKYVDNARERYKNALMRHTVNYTDGNICDSEGGRTALAYVVCNALFLIWLDIKDGIFNTDGVKVKNKVYRKNGR